MNTERKKVAVVGSGGRLGRSLVKALERDHQVAALGRAELDLGSRSSIDRALAKLDYDKLFLTGALTGVDYCEDHEGEAFAVNAAAPGRIAEISAAKGAHVTYISTDLVFDGAKDAPYVETDEPNPISVYGASKLDGERRVLEADGRNLVVRISWVFGPGKPAFPEWIVGRACAEPDLTLPGDKLGCPTFTLDLIEWLTVLAIRPSEAASGIFHLCNSGPCTWRDWGQFCVDTARDAGFPVIAGEIRGVPVDSVAAFVARRPVNSAMSTEKFSALTGFQPRCWNAAIRDFVIQGESFMKYRTECRAP